MTQHEVQRIDFGPSWPEVAGFGEGTPQQAIFEFSRQGKLKNVQVSIHLPCLPVYETLQLPIEVRQVNNS